MMRKQYLIAPALGALLMLSGSVLQAKVTLPSILSDHMVLQQGKPVPIWGKADPGEEVTVEFAEQKSSAIADSEGHWKLSLSPLERSTKPSQMTITGENEIVIEDVVIGDVWLCSGQSNMKFNLNRTTLANETIPKAKQSDIRLFKVEPNHAFHPQDNVAGKWVLCTPKEAADFSAVGYHFGKTLYDAAYRPQGLIQCAVGGTRIQAWIPRSTLEQNSDFSKDLQTVDSTEANFDQLKNQFNNKIIPKWKAEKQQWQEKYGTPYETALKEWQLQAEQAELHKTPVPEKPKLKKREPRKPRFKGTSKNHAASLYNSMVAPLQPYAIAGILWYQGESNARSPEEATQYAILLPMLIESWRDGWNDPELPFLYVQLPGLTPRHTGWPYMRQAQLDTLEVPRTGMVVTSDLGVRGEIHPPHKKPVGERLALLARKLVYQEDILASGPIFESMQIKGDTVRLKFAHTGEGLLNGSVDANMDFEQHDAPLTCFEIAGSDGTYHTVEGIIDGHEVILQSKGVQGPVAVRYGWAGWLNVDLYNSAYLPASPFATDVDCVEFYESNKDTP